MSRAKPDEAWNWEDKTSDFIFENWAHNQPEDALCASIRNIDGLWDGEKCSEKYPFICSQNKSTKSGGKLPNQENCPTSYLPYDESCFKVFQTEQNYDEAVRACQAENTGNFSYGGLAVIMDIFGKSSKK